MNIRSLAIQFDLTDADVERIARLRSGRRPTNAPRRVNTLTTRLLAAVLAVAASVGIAAGAATAQPKPLVVTFEKHLVDLASLSFEGTSGGRAKGALESRMVPGSLTIDGPIWHFAFDWIVDATAEHKSFVARTTGTFDTNTGLVVMDGVVTEGWYEGASVHEEGRLLDPETFTFAGELGISREDG
jgi:hypothetical protein